MEGRAGWWLTLGADVLESRSLNLGEDAIGQAPEAIVIGAMRAGTTSLYHLFRQSGQAAVPESKETDYFLTPDNMKIGIDWYTRQFGESDLPRIDFCPNYTKRDVFPDTWRLIKENAGNAKLVFIARDPVKRAISHYKHSAVFGDKPPPPAEWLGTDGATHAQNVSRYAYQLEPFFDNWDRNDILIVEFDDLLRNPDCLVRIARHVGLADPEALRGEGLPSVNTAKDLNALPSWWYRLRSTPLGGVIRRHTPRDLIDTVRTAIRSDEQKSAVPDFDADVIEVLKENLAPDAELFRKATGMPFEHWCV